MIAATLGLSVSLVAIFSALFFRVALRWHDNADMALTDPARMGAWWRVTWAVLCVGMVPPVIAHLSYVSSPQFLDFPSRVALTLVGLVLLNTAGCMAEMGFNLNRGLRLSAALPIAVLPVAFVIFSMVRA